MRGEAARQARTQRRGGSPPAPSLTERSLWTRITKRSGVAPGVLPTTTWKVIPMTRSGPPPTHGTVVAGAFLVVGSMRAQPPSPYSKGGSGVSVIRGQVTDR